MRSLGGVIAAPTGTATRPQSTLQQAVLRKLSGVLHLPPPTAGFVIDRRLQVPMRDGVALIADHYVPQTTTPSGTLLVRGPYGRGWPFAAVFGSVYAARGYHVLIQSVRGTFGSGGDFDPFVHEIDDGADTVAWLRDQPWFTGTFATMGLSYLGFTQWALLADPPPEMTAAVITVGPHDVSGPRWGTGSFGINDFLGWSDLVARQEDPRRLRVMLRQARAQRLVTQASLGLPLGESSRALLGEGAPWFESWLEHPQADDAFWKRLHLRDAVQRADIPVLFLTGWQDVFLDQTLEQYDRLRSRGVTTGLTIGPWTHSHMMNKAAPTVIRESLDWLDTHLGGAPARRPSPVRVHLAGSSDGAGWLDLTDWPPPMPEHVLYPQPAGRLADTAPDAVSDAETNTATFVYNPADPTPTVGGRLLSPAGGYRDDTALARRADVLTFTGDPADDAGATTGGSAPVGPRWLRELHAARLRLRATRRGHRATRRADIAQRGAQVVQQFTGQPPASGPAASAPNQPAANRPATCRCRRAESHDATGTGASNGADTERSARPSWSDNQRRHARARHHTSTGRHTLPMRLLRRTCRSRTVRVAPGGHWLRCSRRTTAADSARCRRPFLCRRRAMTAADCGSAGRARNSMRCRCCVSS